jgi:hypothetical protein
MLSEASYFEPKFCLEAQLGIQPHLILFQAATEQEHKFSICCRASGLCLRRVDGAASLRLVIKPLR